MDPSVESVRNWFNRIYLGGIPQLMTNDTAFLSFICTLTAIEALAGYRYAGSDDKPGPGARFRDFVQNYFTNEYSVLADDLWNFRKGMIHGFCPRRFALTQHQSHLHLRSTTSGGIVLNAEDFYAALLHASKRYFNELESSAELQATCEARIRSPHGGGIGVGPIEVSQGVA